MMETAQFRWTSAARSHVGLVREINEDACLALPAQGLWAVADGMGGHSVGDVASRLVVKSLSKLRPHPSLGESVTEVRQRLATANRQLRTEADKRGVQIIGSTVVLLLAHERDCSCLWAGDSRLYLYRNGRLRQLTRDHSQAEEFKSRHDLDDDDLVFHPGRNVITRAVGAIDALELDERRVSVSDGDIYLLCSDGLSNEVSEEEISRALETPDCEAAADALIELALARGGRDNISAVVVHAEDLYASDKTVVNPAL